METNFCYVYFFLSIEEAIKGFVILMHYAQSIETLLWYNYFFVI